METFPETILLIVLENSILMYIFPLNLQTKKNRYLFLCNKPAENIQDAVTNTDPFGVEGDGGRMP